MSVQDDTQARISHAAAEETAVGKPAHGVLLTDVASAKVTSLLEQEGRDAPSAPAPAKVAAVLTAMAKAPTTSSCACPWAP